MKKAVLKTLSNFTSDIESYVSESQNYQRGCELMFEYNKLIKRKLKIQLLVPCKLVNGVWMPMEEPKKKYVYSWNPHASPNPLTEEYKEYQEAKNRVIFEGFELVADRLYLDGEDSGLIVRSSSIHWDGDDTYLLPYIEDLTFYGIFPELSDKTSENIIF